MTNVLGWPPRGEVRGDHEAEGPVVRRLHCCDERSVRRDVDMLDPTGAVDQAYSERSTMRFTSGKEDRPSFHLAVLETQEMRRRDVGASPDEPGTVDGSRDS